MSRVKLKFFATYEDYSTRMANDFQSKVDDWIEKNPNYQILSSNICMSGSNAIITIKYYESIKKDLLLENSIKLQE